MLIESIFIKNFRNIKSADLFLSKKINLILGNNAQGKTNIIESIYVSSFLKSFRTQKNSDLVRVGEDGLSVKLKVLCNEVKNNIDINIFRDKKSIKVNGKKPVNYKYLNAVIFHPDEVNYISNYPLFRRNLIDRSIFYNNNNYIDVYRKYYRCLKQRNIFLKEKNNQEDYWLDQIVKYGSEIISERLKFIKKVNSFFISDYFKKINSEEYFISYSKKYKNTESIEDSLKEEFIRKKNREQKLGYTLIGPHKDDIIFYLNERPADTFASQGQKRSLVISFKTAQILDYKAVQGHYPVLILDDMTSELDSMRKNVLLENLLENSGQVFITSTDFKQSHYFDQTKVFKVNNGEVSVAD